MTSSRHIPPDSTKRKRPSSVCKSIGRQSYLSRLSRIWQAMIDSIAPPGYEDETGFHYGKRINTN